jgi:hypothetical protein
MNASDYKTLLADNISKGFEHPDIVVKMDSMSKWEIDMFCVYEGYMEDVDRQIADLWFIVREKFRGGGYYPCPVNKADFDGMETHIFEKDDKAWIQITGDSIEGIYGDYGEQLLHILNDNDKYNCTEIFNIDGVLIFPMMN